jgi:hypothetical protein
MTAQPADPIPVTGPATGSYEVIHLGGQAAVVVPVNRVRGWPVLPVRDPGLPASSGNP